MTLKNNKALTLKVGEIEKNPILALSTGEKDVEQYKRIIKNYGNVAPAIVGESGNAYQIIAGQARLESCAKNGVKEIPVIVAAINDEAEQMKLALLLSTVREGGGSLSEGAFIEALITQHGVTRRELMELLKKSKSWISKRQSLSTRLSENVKVMVKDGVICARTAEEIVKLPEDKQFAFATVAVRDSLSKTDTARLVRLFTREETDSATQETILTSPLAVLDAYPVISSSRRKEKRGLAEQIAGNVGFLLRLSSEFRRLIKDAENQHLDAVKADLNNLYMELKDIITILVILGVGVSPGQPEGGAA